MATVKDELTNEYLNKTELRIFLITLLRFDTDNHDKMNYLKYNLQFISKELKDTDFMQLVEAATDNNIDDTLNTIYNLIYTRIMKG